MLNKIGVAILSEPWGFMVLHKRPNHRLDLLLGVSVCVWRRDANDPASSSVDWHDAEMARAMFLQDPLKRSGCKCFPKLRVRHIADNLDLEFVAECDNGWMHPLFSICHVKPLNKQGCCSDDRAFHGSI